MGKFGTLVVNTPNSGETRYALDNPHVSIGRGAENDVVLLDIKVSRRHAVLHSSTTEWRLEDVGSANGFKHNNNRVREAVLKSGDEVLIGNTTLRVVAGAFISHEDQTMVTMGGSEGFEASLTDHSKPRVVVTRGDTSKEYRITTGKLMFGRGAGVDVLIDHPRVSRNHAEIGVFGARSTLKDLGSRNGTLLNGQALTGEATLENGDTFEIGDARIVFKQPFTADELSVVGLRPVKLPPPAPSASTQETMTSSRKARGDEGHTQEAPLPPAPPPMRKPRGPRPEGRLPVVVVPGFMGSTLFKGEQMVWPSSKTFLKHPEMLKMPEEKDLQPRGLVEEVVVIPGLIKLDAYNRLVEYLVGGLGYTLHKDLFICAYDWRQDLRLGARHLGNLITEWEELPDRAKGKFIVIAHSAGGLVARYYVERMGGRHHVERLILLGAPHKGTPKPLMTMLGGGGGQGLFSGNKKGLKETVGTFLSAYQLLPNYPVLHDPKGPVDLLNDDSWVPEKARLAIKDAREFHDELGTTSRVPVVSIFGYGQKTLAKIEVKRGPDGEFIEPKFFEEECGDGTVSQESAVFPASEIHPVQQQHGALYTDNDVKMRLKLELLGTF